jgi:hypothetical protein
MLLLSGSRLRSRLKGGCSQDWLPHILLQAAKYFELLGLMLWEHGVAFWWGIEGVQGLQALAEVAAL